MKPRNRILVGDARTTLARLAPASIDTVITSPPYYALRDYGVPGQLGLEDNVQAWVDDLRLVARGLARVLRPTGSLWLNLGDAYSRHRCYGAPPKSLLAGPERLLLSLLDDGWVLRNKVVWAKTNPQPSSVADRLSATWEAVYLLARGPKYFFDLDAIRIPHRSARSQPSHATQEPPRTPPSWAGPLAGANDGLLRLKAKGLPGNPLGKNPGDVWTMATAGFRGAHFATFPPALVERPLRATCPERVCTACGGAWRRQGYRVRTQGRLRPTCGCEKPWQPGLVLDPFMGAGTVGLVAERLGRNWLGIELNPAFAQLARERIDAQRWEQRRAA
jgi:DNA modification methylase